MSRPDQFDQNGWCCFPYDEQLAHWVAKAYDPALATSQSPELQQKWLRHQNTWFVGADVLGNAPDASLASTGPLAGLAANKCADIMGVGFDWGPGQVSVCYPGYPRQDPDETDANHRFRKVRDAAHLDGLKPVGPDRRRFMQEYHGFILGIPMHEFPVDAAPFVVWNGSHQLVRDMLARELGAHDPSEWPKIDLTKAYQETRKIVFETCERIEVHTKVGEAYLTHRFAIHGVAPWGGSDDLFRMVVYFRPFWEADLIGWLRS